METLFGNKGISKIEKVLDFKYSKKLGKVEKIRTQKLKKVLEHQIDPIFFYFSHYRKSPLRYP